MSIIIVLAGLILATSGYVQKKGARSRAEAEIAAMSAALESYKADNGIYPTEASTTETLAASADPAGGSPANFEPSGRFLYKELSGDSDGDPTTPSPTSAKNYLGGSLKPNMLSPNPPGPNTYIRDPFGILLWILNGESQPHRLEARATTPHSIFGRRVARPPKRQTKLSLNIRRAGLGTGDANPHRYPAVLTTITTRRLGRCRMISASTAPGSVGLIARGWTSSFAVP